MKVLHLSTSDVRGGAARGAFFLHNALRGLGVESGMLVGRKYSDDEATEELDGALAPATERMRDILDGLPLRRYRKTDDSFWTVGWLPRNLGRAVAARKPDLVHLHWTGGGFLPIDTLRQISCPIVWTVRDMWAFTGGCHYTAGCERYAAGCGRCPQLASPDEEDLSRHIWTRKRAAWRDLDLWLVPLSDWLAGCARRSAVLDGIPIEVIPNGIDSARFRPRPREEARARLGLAADRRYLLYGAIDALRDRRKGFPELLDAAGRLARDPANENVELLVFGGTAPAELPDTGLPTRFLGHIDDDDRLADLYAAADVMVVPSLQEAFGKTLVEAMACGTPVVAFDSGGPRDIVVHERTGYLARPFDPADLAHGIAWCLDGDQAVLGAAARERACEEFDIAVVAGRYLEHYRRILARAA